MKEFETGAVRQTGGKGRMDLIPWSSIIRVSKHMEDALTHYPERNWEKGLPMHTMIDSAFRHLAKYADGMKDEDHLCAAATNLLMAMWIEDHKPEMQDIPAIHLQDTTPVKRKKTGTCAFWDYERGVCEGTKDKEPVSCNGDVDKCEVD